MKKIKNAICSINENFSKTAMVIATSGAVLYALSAMYILNFNHIIYFS